MENATDQQAIAAVLAKARRDSARRRRILVAAGLLLVAAIGGYLLLGRGAGEQAYSYRTDIAAPADITVIVTATGTVEPTVQVDISSEISGIIRDVKVDFNSRVKAGQPLAELDTDMLKASIESARARVAAAQARIAEAEATLEERRAELERRQALAERNVGTRQDLDTAIAAFHRAEAAIASARADYAAAEADLKVNETNLSKACICSPIDGVVLSRSVDRGQVVAASLQAPVLFTIAGDLTRMEVHVDVDEADVGKVAEGQKARFSVDAYPDRRFDAEIRQVRYGSEVIQGVVTYKAILSAANDDLVLRPGMTATAEIVVQAEEGVLSVSNEALRYAPPVTATRERGLLDTLLSRGRRPPGMVQTPAATGRQVWVLRPDGRAEAVPVVTGVTDGRRTQIVSGELKEGDRVIVEAIAQRR